MNYSHFVGLDVGKKTFNLAFACPLSIKKSIGLQCGKNDRIDAKRIANGRNYYFKYVFIDQL